MRVAAFGALNWNRPTATAGRPAEATGLGDRVDFEPTPADLLRQAGAPADQQRRALGVIVNRLVPGQMVPCPTLQAALHLMQNLEADPQADPALKANLNDHLARWSANAAFEVKPPGRWPDLVRGSDPFCVIGSEVYQLPESRPRADLCAALQRVENPPAIDPAVPPRDRPKAPAGQFWDLLHEAGQAELRAFSQQLADRREPLPAELKGQLPELHRRLLLASPERADEPYFQQHLKPAWLDTNNPRGILETIAHFYGPDRVLEEVLELPDHPDRRFHYDQGLECLLRQQTDGRHPRAELLERLADRTRQSLSVPGALSCLALQAERLAPATRLALQEAILEHPEATRLVLDNASTVALVAGTPELAARLWEKPDHPGALALLVRSELDEPEWAALGQRIDLLEGQSPAGAYHAAQLDRQLARMAPDEALGNLPALAATSGVEPGRARQQLMERFLREAPAGEYPRLQRLTGHGAFQPILEKAARDGNLVSTMDALEGSLTRLGRGIVVGHENGVARLFAMQGERSLDELEDRLHQVGEVTRFPWGSEKGEQVRFQLLALLDRVPTSQLSPCLERLRSFLDGSEEEKTLGHLAVLSRGLDLEPALEAYQKIQAASPWPEKELVRILETASTLTGDQLDRQLAVLGSPLGTADALSLGPLAEQLHQERGGEVFDQGVRLLDQLEGMPPGEQLASARVGLRSLLAGEDAATARARTLRSAVMQEPGAPTGGVVLDGSRLRVGGQWLPIKLRQVRE